MVKPMLGFLSSHYPRWPGYPCCRRRPTSCAHRDLSRICIPLRRISALLLFFNLALIGELLNSETQTGTGFFAAYAIGGLGGAVFGLTKSG